MKAQDLKKSILQYAMQGKLVPQDPNEEPASVLLERIKAEKEQLIKEGKIKKEKPLVPITEDEIPYELPIGWEWVRFQNVIDVRDGTHDSPKYVKEGIPLITSKNLDNGKINFDNVNYITNEDHIQISQRSKVESNDILFAMIGSIGNPVIVDMHREFSIKNVALFKNNNQINKNYLYYYLYYQQYEFKQLSSGAVQSFVSLTFLRNFLFAIPPLSEQKRIVEKLEQILPLIDEYDKNEQKLTTINEKLPSKLRQSILQYAVEGKLVPQDSNDEPASILLEKIKVEKEQLVKEGKIKKEKHLPVITENEIPYILPQNWKWVRLKDICYNLGQKTPNSNFTYIDVTAINKDKGIISDDYQILTADKAPSRARKLVKVGTVIYSTVRPYLLNIAIVDKKFTPEPIVSTAFAIMHPYSQIYNKYLYFYLRSKPFIDYVSSKMIGMAYPAINDAQLFMGIMPLPPLEEQKRIVAKVDELMKLCNELEKQIKNPKLAVKILEEISESLNNKQMAEV